MGKEINPEVSWRHKDVGSSLGAFGMFLANMNPTRWSGDRTMKQCSEEFEELANEEGEIKRPVQFKIKETKHDFENMKAAFDYLEKEIANSDQTIEPFKRKHIDCLKRVENARENVRKAEKDLADAEKRAKEGGANVQAKIEQMEAEEKKRALLQEFESKKQALANIQAILNDEEPQEVQAKTELDAAMATVTKEINPEVSWKYKDVGSSLGAFGRFLANMNPTRWSG